MNLTIGLTQQMSLYLVLAYMLTKTPVLRPMVDLALGSPHKLVLYITFSCLCVMGTYFGEQTHDAIANTRAMGAVLSGLLGGPVTGFFVGLTGGLHRYSLGGFTDLACAVSTTLEGTFAGLMHLYLVRRKNLEQLFNPFWVFAIALVAELLQMATILILAEPFTDAWQLVKTIAIPMLLVNSLGAAMFMSMIRDQRAMAEKISSIYSAKALKIAERTVGHLSQGFNQQTAGVVAKIIFEETGVSAVAITDCSKLLAFIGHGADHHLPATPIASAQTAAAIRNNEVVFIDGIEHQFSCSISNQCQLGSCLIVPLRGENEVIGTVKLYEKKSRFFLNLNQTLGEGIARVLENQILHSRFIDQKNLLVQNELKLLQAQINPHFLFNALNTLNAVIRIDRDKARELTQQLASFLRANLKRGTDTITLAEELEHVGSYLKIERARFGEQLEVSWQIAPELTQATMPTFTLQPLVENAVKHGTSTLLEVGKINISAQQIDGKLQLSVTDNAGAYRPSGESDGLGMGIVDKRIKTMFGTEYGITIECEPDQFTRINVLLPMSTGA
ncbi:sensor histidine kinase [Ferrimonas lipolytica]|uniref:histidine kinase n=1 Tax=Ferrimonas lipolytica TaxID=2724191 RepID=A0A6H1UIC2_9GAMM|nr:sensor histidine kinase [Ferrimonas lipolytica]QIZ78857.1 sensor histidine kinase [Ferrimonas lipolytica]